MDSKSVTNSGYQWATIDTGPFAENDIYRLLQATKRSDPAKHLLRHVKHFKVLDTTTIHGYKFVMIRDGRTGLSAISGYGTSTKIEKFLFWRHWNRNFVDHAKGFADPRVVNRLSAWVNRNEELYGALSVKLSFSKTQDFFEALPGGQRHIGFNGEIQVPPGPNTKSYRTSGDPLTGNTWGGQFAETVCTGGHGFANFKPVLKNVETSGGSLGDPDKLKRLGTIASRALRENMKWHGLICSVKAGLVKMSSENLAALELLQAQEVKGYRDLLFGAPGVRNYLDKDLSDVQRFADDQFATAFERRQDFLGGKGDYGKNKRPEKWKHVDDGHTLDLLGASKQELDKLLKGPPHVKWGPKPPVGLTDGLLNTGLSYGIFSGVITTGVSLASGFSNRTNESVGEVVVQSLSDGAWEGLETGIVASTGKVISNVLKRAGYACTLVVPVTLQVWSLGKMIYNVASIPVVKVASVCVAGWNKYLRPKPLTVDDVGGISGEILKEHKRRVGLGLVSEDDAVDDIRDLVDQLVERHRKQGE